MWGHIQRAYRYSKVTSSRRLPTRTGGHLHSEEAKAKVERNNMLLGACNPRDRPA